MYCFLCVVFCFTKVIGITLYDAKNPISSDRVDVRVEGRSNSDLHSRRMAYFYDIRFTVNEEQIRARLTRKDVDKNLMADVKDWATYTSKDIDGVFLLHRSQNNRTAITMEGYMLHKGSPYLIQPHATFESHVIHRIGDNLTHSEDYPKSRRARPKRNLRLKRRMTVTIDVYFDKAAWDYVRAKAGKVTDKVDVEDFLNKYYTMLIIYIDHMLASLKKWGTKISCAAGRRFFFQLSDAEKAKIIKGQSTDMIRETACGVSTLEYFAQKSQPYSSYDHSMLVTGYDILNSHGDETTRGMSYMETICTENSASVIELGFELTSLITGAHELMHSFGASHDGEKGVPAAQDCKEEENYVMSAGRNAPYTGPYQKNTWLFSPCTNKMIVEYLTKIEGKTSQTCLTERVGAVTPTKLPRYVMSPDERCKLILGPLATYSPNRTPDTTVCSKGLRCYIAWEQESIVIHVMPFPGTPCGRGRDKVKMMR